MDDARAARRASMARLAKAIEELVDPPNSASEWADRFSTPEHTNYHQAIDGNLTCNCGGRDGVIVSVLSCANRAPKMHNKIVVTAFNHHEGGQVALATIDIEAAKQIVNRLGEAIAVAERVQRQEATDHVGTD